MKIGTHPKCDQSLFMMVLFIKFFKKSSLNIQKLGAKYGAFRNLNNTTKKSHNFKKII